jgi:hypothetical protein
MIRCAHCKDRHETVAEVRLCSTLEDLPPQQFCRAEVHSCIPAITLTFNNGASRLHWCADHAEDADRYWNHSDQAAADWQDELDRQEQEIADAEARQERYIEEAEYRLAYAENDRECW